MSGQKYENSYLIWMYRYHLNSGKKVREVEKYLILQNAPFILKTPYSSSGRGLLWLPERKLTTKDRTWIEGALNKQGCVSIECALTNTRFRDGILFRRKREHTL